MKELNVNYLMKLDFLKKQIPDNIDILITSGIKIDGSFPIGQFLLNGCSTAFRLYRNDHGGDVLLYVRKNILSNFFLWKKILSKAFLWR